MSIIQLEISEENGDIDEIIGWTKDWNKALVIKKDKCYIIDIAIKAKGKFKNLD